MIMKKVVVSESYLGASWSISKKPYTSWKALGLCVALALVASIAMLS